MLYEFLKVARPIWCRSIRGILEIYAEQPSDTNLARLTRFGKNRILKGDSSLSCGKDLIDHCLPLWLTREDIVNEDFESIKLKLSSPPVNEERIQVFVEAA